MVLTTIQDMHMKKYIIPLMLIKYAHTVFSYIINLFSGFQLTLCAYKSFTFLLLFPKSCDVDFYFRM